MHGLGNDYVFLDAVADPNILLRSDLAGLTRAVCDRGRGIGADGVILVMKPPEGQVGIAMRILNADGGNGGMCGNGARCVCKLAVERGHVSPDADGRMTLWVGERRLSAWVSRSASRPGRIDRVTIDLGPPRLGLPDIPVDASKLDRRGGTRGAHEHDVDGYPGVFVNVGNPHLVIFTNHDPDALADRIGPTLETHPAFPERMNVQIARTVSPDRVLLRTWERGSGRTRACGTGACAAVVAGILTDRCSRRTAVSMLGGDLEIEWVQSGGVLMIGPAEHSFDGDWPEDLADLSRVATGLFPSLHTARLVLRPLAIEQAPAIAELSSRFEVARHTLTVPHPYPPGAELDFLQRVLPLMLSGDFAAWTIHLDDSGRLVGTIGLRIDKLMKTAELGYSLNVEDWGKGFATEAARAVVGYGFERLGLRKVHACYHAANPASGRVLEKAGFSREGIRPSHGERFGTVHDLVEVGLLRTAWAQSH